MSDPAALATEIRDKAVACWTAAGKPRATLADRLGVFPSGVDRIMSDPTWTLERGILVLDAFGVDVNVTVTDPTPST